MNNTRTISKKGFNCFIFLWKNDFNCIIVSLVLIFILYISIGTHFYIRHASFTYGFMFFLFTFLWNTIIKRQLKVKQNQYFDQTWSNNTKCLKYNSIWSVKIACSLQDLQASKRAFSRFKLSKLWWKLQNEHFYTYFSDLYDF